MIKRFIAIALALIIMGTLFGCAAVKPNGQSDAQNTEAAATDSPTTKVSFVNAAGEATPLTVYNASLVLPNPLTYDERYTIGANAFAVKMTEALSAIADKDWSGVYSPLSLQIILQLLANGADEELSHELLTAVCGGMEREDVNICTAKLMSIFGSIRGVSMNNAVVVNKAYRVNKSFADTAGSYYNAAIGTLDFNDVKAASEALNGWVSEKTEGQVKELIKDLSSDAVMVLLNTLYFDMDWDEYFIVHRNLTEFNGVKGTEWVSMMQRSDELLYGSFDEGQMAVIPYKNEDYAMAVILPEKNLTPAEAVSALIGRWNDCELKTGMVSMPKVEQETDIDVMQLVSAMGLENALKGDYRQLLEGDFDLAVSKIVQGARISVNERGTTAAAATAAELLKGVPGVNQFELICDRPYAMVIYNTETGTVMFVSIVNSLG